MIEFSNFADKYIEYVQAQQDNHIGLAENVWFNEFFAEYIENILPQDQAELLRVFKEEAVDCGTRSSLKEMMDFISTVVRAKNIRDKRRTDFFADTAVRAEGVKYNLGKKKQELDDIISKVRDV